MYQSLFEYLGTPAGPELGKRIYAEAKRRRVKVSSRQVNTRKYKGTILAYPVSFLDSYFGASSQIVSSYYSNLYAEELPNSKHSKHDATPQKKSLIETLY